MDFLGLSDIRSRLSGVEAKETPPCDHSKSDARLDALEDHRETHARNITTTEDDQRLLFAAIDTLTDQIAELKLAIDEGILKTNRAERRVRTAVSRARSELSELGIVDPTVEAEASELRDVDGVRSETVGVLPVRGEVEGNAETPSSIPGVSIEQIRRMRGI